MGRSAIRSALPSPYGPGDPGTAGRGGDPSSPIGEGPDVDRPLRSTARLTPMREPEVQDAFAKYLIEHGWEVKTDNDDYTDVIAWRGDELLVAEVKGTTSAPGLDVDTAYGQLLRRMRDRPETVRYALVVPDSARMSALRVSDEVRRRIGIDVWTVDEAGNVQLAE